MKKRICPCGIGPDVHAHNCDHAWTPTSYESIKDFEARQHCLLCGTGRTWRGGYGPKQAGGRWVLDP